MLAKRPPPVGTVPCNRLASAHCFFLKNKLDDCPSRFENAHLFSPMNLHLQPQESFFRRLCRHPAFLFGTCGASCEADSSVTPSERPLFYPFLKRRHLSNFSTMKSRPHSHSHPFTSPNVGRNTRSFFTTIPH